VSSDAKRKHPALIVLRALLEGNAVVADGEEYRYDEKGVFGVVRKRFICGTGVEAEPVVLGIEMTVEQFVKWCETLPEEVVIQTVFGTVMRQGRKVRKGM